MIWLQLKSCQLCISVVRWWLPLVAHWLPIKQIRGFIQIVSNRGVELNSPKLKLTAESLTEAYKCRSNSHRVWLCTRASANFSAPVSPQAKRGIDSKGVLQGNKVTFCLLPVLTSLKPLPCWPPCDVSSVIDIRTPDVKAQIGSNHNLMQYLVSLFWAANGIVCELELHKT